MARANIERKWAVIEAEREAREQAEQEASRSALRSRPKPDPQKRIRALSVDLWSLNLLSSAAITSCS